MGKTNLMNDDQGWVSIHRKLSNSDLWLSEKFTRGQAWVDILMLANHKKNTLYIRGNEVIIDRGEVGWSEESLAHRWKWSRNKVRRFKLWLKRNNRITIRNNKILGVMTIINYNKYQQMEQQNSQQTIQQKNIRKYTNNNDNNDNNEKNKKKTSKNSHTACTEEELKEIAILLDIDLESVKRTHDIILNKIKAGEFKKYKTVYYTLKNWLLMGIERGTIKKKITNSILSNYKLMNPKCKLPLD